MKRRLESALKFAIQSKHLIMGHAAVWTEEMCRGGNSLRAAK